MKMMHPHTHVVVVIRLKALSSQFKPFLDSLRVQPWINAQLDLFKNQKRSIHHTWKHFLVPGKLVMLWNVKHCTLSSNAGKKFSKFDNHPSWQSHKKRKWSPVQRPVVQQVDRRQGETWKCQLLDFAWTNYQVEFCKFRVRSTVPISYLERYSPKLMSSHRIRHESHTCSDLS